MAFPSSLRNVTRLKKLHHNSHTLKGSATVGRQVRHVGQKPASCIKNEAVYANCIRMVKDAYLAFPLLTWKVSIGYVGHPAFSYSLQLFHSNFLATLRSLAVFEAQGTALRRDRCYDEWPFSTRSISAQYIHIVPNAKFRSLTQC